MMESVTLSKTPRDTVFDECRCIICQTTSDDKLVRTANGCKRIREASDVHNDNVSKRIKLVEGDSFYYHVTNACYKQYTSKTVLDRITKQTYQGNNPYIPGQNLSDDRGTRFKTVRHPVATETTTTALRDVNCIICGNKSLKRTYTKYRISEYNQATSFLEATHFFQDDVFARTCDLQDPHRVFGADLYYHNECMLTYIYKYESRSKEMKPIPSTKQRAWSQVVSDLDQGLKSGKGYELSVIRDNLNIIDDKSNFRNRDVNIFLINQFGSEVDFTNPDVLNTSAMVYSVSNVAANELAERIRSVDFVQVCASVIRMSLDNYDFGLEDSFCDAQDIKQACNDMVIPDPLLRFFGVFYNFDPDTYQKAAESVMTDKLVTEPEDADEDAEDDRGTYIYANLSTQRCRKIHSLFQAMYYIHHCGRKRTPMHIMNAESVHSRGRGGKIVTTALSHEGLSLSYTELRRYQHDLASYTGQHNHDRVGLPNHFDPGQFTFGAIDNWDHEGANISEHDTVTVLYQNKHPSLTCKPKVSDTLVKHGPRAFSETLQCQRLSDFHKSA